VVIAYDDFARVDMRAGTIREVRPFPQARKPAYKLLIDFGSEIGTRWSSAQITALYAHDRLIGTQIIAVVNFAPKRIAGFSSEVLVLGVPDAQGNVVLLRPERAVHDGAAVY
jgi:tRNA-binding protein